jgi:hypothetical protein
MKKNAKEKTALLLLNIQYEKPWHEMFRA